MQKYLIIILTAVGLIVLGGFLIKQYGATKEDLGVATEKADQVIAVTDTQEKDRVQNEKIDMDTERMQIDDIDLDLIRLGIMRGDSDR